MMSATTSFLEEKWPLQTNLERKGRQHGDIMKQTTSQASTKGHISKVDKNQAGTPLTKTPKEIMVMDTVKFEAPPPMSSPAKNWKKNKFCNSQVKDNKIDLLVQQYEQFVISEEESIDIAFARFNTIITSLNALDEGYSSKNYDEFIKSSVEDLVPVPSESGDTSGSNSEYVLPSCDDFSPIIIFEEESVPFSNHLLNSNDDFTFSDDESLSDEELEDIECKDSYDSNFDESTFLVTPLSESNEDEYFTPGDDVELLLHRDPSTPMMSDKIFDPEIHDQIFSPTYVSLPIEVHHYLFFTCVVRIFLPHFTYPVVSPFLLSSGSEDTIFDPSIFAFHFSYRSGTFINFNVYPDILNESPMEIFSSTRFNPNITMIWGSPLPFSCFVFYVQDCLDFEDSRARDFVHRPLELLSLSDGNLIS
uniref:UBN2 domain-containing protein n=1 Tax=Tanacetum cinerariifolium TaxID=118510 RepID=A0A6L2LGL7_TANCI|nr:UBN2 domain-containing protein [Tanacetum cinerariifolium]